MTDANAPKEIWYYKLGGYPSTMEQQGQSVYAFTRQSAKADISYTRTDIAEKQRKADEDVIKQLTKALDTLNNLYLETNDYLGYRKSVIEQSIKQALANKRVKEESDD